MTESCPFCAPDAARLIFEHELAYGLWDGYPVSPGHALLIPRRHVATWFDASAEEHLALTAAIEEARRRVLERFAAKPPDGFNIGVNAGLSAGQTVMHLHVHLIPRWMGDVPNPRGGVRHLMPGKGHYDPSVAPEVPATGPVDPGAVARDRASASLSPAAVDLAPLPHPRALIVGEGDRLIDHLRVHMARALRMDLAVAFVQRSGLELVRPYLEELLAREGARVRLVAGDYLDVTDPDALARLRDLVHSSPEGALDVRIFETGGVRSFHPKAYVFHGAGGADAVALVGSSNGRVPRFV